MTLAPTNDRLDDGQPPKGKTHKTKSDRLDLRLTPDVKEEIERAAALSGQPVSSFVLGATIAHARQVIHEAQRIALSDRDRDRFLTALDNDDAKPNDALLRTIERFNNATR